MQESVAAVRNFCADNPFWAELNYFSNRFKGS